MKDVLVLCYHAVSPSWTASLSITPDRFERHLETLVRRGYTGATFGDAVRAPSGKTVAITFDDGYGSVFDLAFPLMRAAGLVGTVFVVTESVGGDRPLSWPGIDDWIGTEHERELRPMDADQLRHLIEAGWQIGSHTRTHPRLTTLTEDALAEELAVSREQCTSLTGRPCETIAYPYGDVNERVVTAAGEAGYRWAGALSSRLSKARPLEWPRVGIYYEDDDRRFDAKVSPAIRRLRSTSAWGALNKARWALRRPG